MVLEEAKRLRAVPPAGVQRAELPLDVWGRSPQKLEY